MKLDLNKILLILAVVAGLAPDFAAVSAWLADIGVPWLVAVSHAVAVVAAACAGLAHAIPRLRGVLSALGLATPPGEVAPAPSNKSNPPAPPAAAALALFGLLAVSASCHNVKPDAFAGAVVDCARVQPTASAALAGVKTCLIGAMAQNYAACLAGLVSEGHFAFDDVACVVAWYAEQQNAKVGASTASLDELAARDRANAWLAQEQISIRNSYR